MFVVSAPKVYPLYRCFYQDFFDRDQGKVCFDENVWSTARRGEIDVWVPISAIAVQTFPRGFNHWFVPFVFLLGGLPHREVYALDDGVGLPSASGSSDWGLREERRHCWVWRRLGLRGHIYGVEGV